MIRLLSRKRLQGAAAAQRRRAADRLDAVGHRPLHRAGGLALDARRGCSPRDNGGTRVDTSSRTAGFGLGLAQRHRRDEPGRRRRPPLGVRSPGGGLNVYRPTTGRARRRRSTPAPGHWNSPIVVDGTRRASRGQRERPRDDAACSTSGACAERAVASCARPLRPARVALLALALGVWAGSRSPAAATRRAPCRSSRSRADSRSPGLRRRRRPAMPTTLYVVEQPGDDQDRARAAR